MLFDKEIEIREMQSPAGENITVHLKLAGFDSRYDRNRARRTDHDTTEELWDALHLGGGNSIALLVTAGGEGFDARVDQLEFAAIASISKGLARV